MKQKLLILLVAVLGSLSALAADVLTPKQDPATGLYGYVNQKGKWKIKPAYKGANDFFAPGETSKQQYAWVQEADGMYTLINGKGKVALQGKYHAVTQPINLGHGTLFAQVQKSANGPKQILLIHDKQLIEVPDQYTTISSISSLEPKKVRGQRWGEFYEEIIYPSEYTFYLENGEKASLLTIDANEAITVTKPLDFKIVSEPYHGYYMVVKNGEHQLYNLETNTLVPLEKFFSFWISSEVLFKDISRQPLSPILVDKDFNILGAFDFPSGINKLQDEANQKFLPVRYVFSYEHPKDNSYVLLDLVNGKIMGQFGHVYFTNSDYIMVKKNGSWGLMDPDGKYVMPTQYEDIGIIKDNSGKCQRIATISRGNAELFDMQGKKVATIPGLYHCINEDEGTNFLKLTCEGSLDGIKYHIGWFDINGKQLTPDGCKSITKYEKNGKQVGWIADNKIIYDMNMKRIGTKATKKERDYVAELYKKRNFVGRPIGMIFDMKDRGFVKRLKGVWSSAVDGRAIFDISLKDGSVYRIETNDWAQIIKAKKYR